MNILVTAIGSMSGQCVITALKKRGHRVIGCDIYPGEWHYETTLCDNFYRAPFATSKAYIPFLLEVVKKELVDFVIPLTDVEVDALVANRDCFKNSGATLCISDSETIAIARNKFKLFQFLEREHFPAIPSYHSEAKLTLSQFKDFPYFAKPCNGRSSEGVVRVEKPEVLELILHKKNYLIQEIKDDNHIYTVDVLRQAWSDEVVLVPRRELLRTSNGAGLTVQLSNSEELKALTLCIARKLNVNGCVNMEFIYDDNCYYLIDVNPRFSAGVGFSQLTGNDFVNGHLACFWGKERLAKIHPYQESILVKRDIETVIG